MASRILLVTVCASVSVPRGQLVEAAGLVEPIGDVGHSEETRSFALVDAPALVERLIRPSHRPSRSWAEALVAAAAALPSEVRTPAERCMQGAIDEIASTPHLDRHCGRTSAPLLEEIRRMAK